MCCSSSRHAESELQLLDYSRNGTQSPSYLAETFVSFALFMTFQLRVELNSHSVHEWLLGMQHRG